YAVPMAGNAFLGIPTGGVGIILLGLSSTDHQVGIFAIAAMLQAPGVAFLPAVGSLFSPIVTDLFQRGAIERLRSMLQMLARWIATFSLPVFAIVSLEAEFFTSLFGDRATAAAGLVWIMALGNIVNTATGPTALVLSMTGRPGINFMNLLVTMLLYVVVGSFAAREMGAFGMAMVDAGATALVNILRAVECRLLVGIHPFGRTYYKPVLAAAGGAAVLFVWKVVAGAGGLQSVAGIALGSLVYLAILRVLRLDPEEKHVWEAIRNRLKTLRR
ncbi:MAG: lipopolysaccharide biosynthesis protein, partial [Actinomycetota bacterium]